MSVSAQLPPVIQRHELKYLIPWEMVEPISRFIRPYCSLDQHSASARDHFYLVNSLYFDTRGFEFLYQRLWGKDIRFNMRVRAYADGTQPPYFLEIKQKKGSSVTKYRATISAQEWPAILTAPDTCLSEPDNPFNQRSKQLFMRLAASYNIEPKILTQYYRRAFFSTIDDYARVTIDRNMRYQLESEYNLQPGPNMAHYDNETIYSTNQRTEARAVLELKCNIGQVPIWMLDLIRHFELQQMGFSKYMNSMLVAHIDNGNHYMDLSRQSALHVNDSDPLYPHR